MENRLTAYWERMKAIRPAPVIDPGTFVGDDPAANERAVREGFMAKARRQLASLPMAHEVVAMYFCLLDAKTPVWVKATVGAALAYFILPVDAIPDLLPLVGLSDDAGVLAAAFTAVSSHITEGHRNKASAWMADEKIGPGPNP